MKSDRQTFGLLNEFCCHDFRTPEGTQRGRGGWADHQGVLVFVFRWCIPGLGEKLEIPPCPFISAASLTNMGSSHTSAQFGSSNLPEWMNLVAQLCLTLCNPMDCSLPGPSVHGILQARILEWIAIPFSRGSSQLRDWNWVSCITGRFFTDWTTRTSKLNKALPQRNLLAEGLNLGHLHVLSTLVLEKKTLI